MIFTFASGVFAVKAATPTIVFVLADDPVRLGLIINIARPGGNLTGINFLNAELGAKRLDLLRVLVPTATRIVLLGTPTGAFADAALRNTEVAARAVGLQIQSQPTIIGVIVLPRLTAVMFLIRACGMLRPPLASPLHQWSAEVPLSGGHGISAGSSDQRIIRSCCL